MRLRLISVLIAAVLCLALCGCDSFTSNTAELLSPPDLSGDISPIAEAIASRNPEKASMLMQKHIDMLVKALEDQLSELKMKSK